jgi:4-carboxymuconolactone decarboxylase
MRALRRRVRVGGTRVHDSDTISDDLWSQLTEEWSQEQLLELVVTAGWYRLLSYVMNACRIELEPWAARFSAG